MEMKDILQSMGVPDKDTKEDKELQTVKLENDLKDKEPNIEIKTPEPKAEEEVPKEVDEYTNLITVAEFFKKHEDLITNTTMIGLDISAVNKDQYILFKTKEEENAELYLFGECDKLFIKPFTPTSIRVHGSGAVVKGDGVRVYIGKSNVQVFELNDDQTPDRWVIIRKSKNGSPKIQVRENSVEDQELDVIKVYINRTNARLANMVGGCTNVDDLRKGVLGFMDSVIDLNHLIKLEVEVLMATSL